MSRAALHAWLLAAHHARSRLQAFAAAAVYHNRTLARRALHALQHTATTATTSPGPAPAPHEVRARGSMAARQAPPSHAHRPASAPHAGSPPASSAPSFISLASLSELLERPSPSPSSSYLSLAELSQQHSAGGNGGGLPPAHPHPAQAPAHTAQQAGLVVAGGGQRFGAALAHTVPPRQSTQPPLPDPPPDTLSLLREFAKERLAGEWQRLRCLRMALLRWRLQQQQGKGWSDAGVRARDPDPPIFSLDAAAAAAAACDAAAFAPAPAATSRLLIVLPTSRQPLSSLFQDAQHARAAAAAAGLTEPGRSGTATRARQRAHALHQVAARAQGVRDTEAASRLRALHGSRAVAGRGERGRRPKAGYAKSTASRPCAPSMAVAFVEELGLGSCAVGESGRPRRQAQAALGHARTHACLAPHERGVGGPLPLQQLHGHGAGVPPQQQQHEEGPPLQQQQQRPLHSSAQVLSLWPPAVARGKGGESSSIPPLHGANQEWGGGAITTTTTTTTSSTFPPAGAYWLPPLSPPSSETAGGDSYSQVGSSSLSLEPHDTYRTVY